MGPRGGGGGGTDERDTAQKLRADGGDDADDKRGSFDVEAALADMESVTGHLPEPPPDPREAPLRDAIAAAEAQHGREHWSVVAAMGDVAWLYATKAQMAAAEAGYRAALELLDTLGAGGDHLESVRTLLGGTEVALARGDHGAAEARCRAAIAMQRRLVGDGDDQVVAMARSLLGVVLKDAGRFADARGEFVSALDALTRMAGGDGDFVDAATLLGNVGDVELAQGDVDAAEASFFEALRMSQRLHAGDHPGLARAMSDAGRVLRARGRLDDAERHLKRALEMLQRIYGDQDHAEVAAANVALARLGVEQDAAIRAAEQAAMAGTATPETSTTPATATTSATTIASAALRDAAVAAATALNMAQRVHNYRASVDVAEGLLAMGEVYAALGRLFPAEALLSEAATMGAAVLPPGHASAGAASQQLRRLRDDVMPHAHNWRDEAGAVLPPESSCPCGSGEPLVSCHARPRIEIA